MKKFLFFTAVFSITALFSFCEISEVDVKKSNHTTVKTKGSFTQVSSFGSNPGNLTMYKYVPDGISENAPLVVAMHGCGMSANMYKDSGWNGLADQYKFYVIYPEQKSANNMNSCFNFFEPGDMNRDQGESLSIKSMVDYMKNNYSINEQKVFVNGFSAGGYMAPVMMATYPDVFSGLSINSGGPYKCATNMNDAFNCMNPGVNKTPSYWGDLVRNATSFNATYGPVKIVQGENDHTVRPINATELKEQWENAGSNTSLKMFANLGHNVPINSAIGCGVAYTAFTSDGDYCSHCESLKQWGFEVNCESGGDGDGDGDGDCTEITSTNDSHVSNDRAYTETSTGWWWFSDITSYFAVGSNDTLGSSGTISNTLYSTDEGATWNKGQCPGGDGDSCNSCDSYSCCVGYGCAGYSYINGGMKCYEMSGYTLVPCSCWQ